MLFKLLLVSYWLPHYSWVTEKLCHVLTWYFCNSHDFSFLKILLCQSPCLPRTVGETMERPLVWGTRSSRFCLLLVAWPSANHGSSLRFSSLIGQEGLTVVSPLQGCWEAWSRFIKCISWSPSENVLTALQPLNGSCLFHWWGADHGIPLNLRTEAENWPSPLRRSPTQKKQGTQQPKRGENVQLLVLYISVWKFCLFSVKQENSNLCIFTYVISREI